MMVQARNRRMGGRLNNMELRSDRFFPEKIMGKYVGKASRFRAMTHMIFGKKATRFFSFKLNMILSVPLQVMGRYSLPRKIIHPSSNQTVSAPVFTSIFTPVSSDSVRREFHWKQVVQNFLGAHGATAGFSQLGYARTAANAATQAFNYFATELSAMFRHPSPAAIQRERWEDLTRYGSETGNEGFFVSFAKQLVRRARRRSVDQISEGQSMLWEELKRRHETPVFALQSGIAGIHETSGRSRASLAEEAQELIFRGTDKIGREIDELKGIVKKTEDQVHEKVAHQVREIMAERNRQVDVGSLTLQVYRNMEKMIRIERERRGM